MVDLTQPIGNLATACALNPNGEVRPLLVDADQKLIISNRSGAYPTNWIERLRLEYSAADKVKINPGSCRDDGDTTNLKLTAAVTIDIDGTGANGLDTGAKAAHTWYRVWLIYNPTTTTYAGLASTSASPTMPAGYTLKRRAGWIRTDGSSNIWPFWQQEDNWVFWDQSSDHEPLNSAAPATTYTDLDCSASIPPSVTLAFFLGYGESAAAKTFAAVYLRRNGTLGAYNTTGFLNAGASGTISVRSAFTLNLDTAQVIEYKALDNASGALALVKIDVVSWYDERRT
jgi:hypothetical protein